MLHRFSWWLVLVCQSGMIACTIKRQLGFKKSALSCTFTGLEMCSIWKARSSHAHSLSSVFTSQHAQSDIALTSLIHAARHVVQSVLAHITMRGDLSRCSRLKYCLTYRESRDPHNLHLHLPSGSDMILRQPRAFASGHTVWTVCSYLCHDKPPILVVVYRLGIRGWNP